jgi:hypothetical protein
MMNRAPKILLALMIAAASAAAQETAPPAPAAVAAPPATAPTAAPGNRDATTIVLSPAHEVPVPPPAADSDGVNRTVSPRIADALASGMPKYSLPTPTPVVLDNEDLRDVDKPKNEIPRLPKYVVHESRPAVFRDRDLYTQEGLVSLSYKYHPGLGIGNLLGLNDQPAYEMYLDDVRQANVSDLTDTAHAMARGGDTAGSAYILQQTQETFMRPADDWTWSGPGGGLNGGGLGK